MFCSLLMIPIMYILLSLASPSIINYIYIKSINNLFWCIQTDVKLKFTDFEVASKQFELLLVRLSNWRSNTFFNTALG